MWLTCSTPKGNRLEKVGLVWISIGLEDVETKKMFDQRIWDRIFLGKNTGCMIILHEAATSKDPLGMLSNSLDLPKKLTKNRNPSFQLRLQRWWNPRSWLFPGKLSPLCLGWLTGKSTMVKFQTNEYNEFQYCNHFWGMLTPKCRVPLQQLGCPGLPTCLDWGLGFGRRMAS